MCGIEAAEKGKNKKRELSRWKQRKTQRLKALLHEKEKEKLHG